MAADIAPVARFFWDCDPSRLAWEQQRDFIIRRVLEVGDLTALRWLRSQVGAAALRQWIIDHHAKNFSPRQIRYWALILGIEQALADEWVKTSASTLWEKRR